MVRSMIIIIRLPLLHPILTTEVRYFIMMVISQFLQKISLFNAVWFDGKNFWEIIFSVGKLIFFKKIIF